MNEAARILIVEDDPHLLQATSRLLRRAGHEVLEAATGSDALRLSGEQRPDLILLDVVLPDADGVEICRRIKADASLAGSFVVMLSGVETESQNRVAGLEAGADGYIVRPIPNQELLARVQALLRIQQAERALQRAHDDLELRVQQRTIELARMNRALMEEIAQRQLIEQALQRARDELEMRVEERAAELNERVKELGCLYGISHLVESPGVTLGEILQGTAELIPSAWQYPEITGARILLEGQEFSTENFRETAWMQACDIVVRGEPVGRVQVCYVEERPERDEGPFLKEERALLSAIAERLGRVAGRVRAEQALRQSEGLLRTIAANYPAYLSIIEKGEKDLVVGFTSGKQFEKLGLDPRDFVGLTVEQVFGEQAAVVREHYLKAFGGEEVAFQLQVNNQHQSYSAVPLYDEEGRIRRVLAVVEDITERKQAEEALRRRTAELQARNEEPAHDCAQRMQDERYHPRATVAVQCARRRRGQATTGHGPHRDRGPAAPGQPDPRAAGRDCAAHSLAHSPGACAVGRRGMGQLSQQRAQVWRLPSPCGIGCGCTGGRIDPTYRALLDPGQWPRSHTQRTSPAVCSVHAAGPGAGQGARAGIVHRAPHCGKARG
jgi:PAS domain S-box-containing protein